MRLATKMRGKGVYCYLKYRIPFIIHGVFRLVRTEGYRKKELKRSIKQVAICRPCLILKNKPYRDRLFYSKTQWGRKFNRDLLLVITLTLPP
jgi:hypothetical protein